MCSCNFDGEFSLIADRQRYPDSRLSFSRVGLLCKGNSGASIAVPFAYGAMIHISRTIAWQADCAAAPPMPPEKFDTA